MTKRPVPTRADRKEPARAFTKPARTASPILKTLFQAIDDHGLSHRSTAAAIGVHYVSLLGFLWIWEQQA